MAIKLKKKSRPDKTIEIKSILVTEGEIINTIKSLTNKKSTGYNNISSKVIKALCDRNKSLTYIFNNSLKEGP